MSSSGPGRVNRPVAIVKLGTLMLIVIQFRGGTRNQPLHRGVSLCIHFRVGNESTEGVRICDRSSVSALRQRCSG
jgi:hypothetical protein